MIWTKIKKPFRRFADEDSGSVAMEAILVWPLLLWAYGATFVYFDAFRAKNLAMKAAYTVSDTISREYNAVNSDYIDTMYDMVNILSNSQHNAKMRITMVKYRKSDNKYLVVWSKSRGTAFPELTTTTLQTLNPELPVLPDGEQVIMVETKALFEPFLKVGLGVVEHKNEIFTRPRFVAHICYEAGNTLTCGT